jgi:hypothetical protein
MICDICKRKFNYCFYINDEHWLKAVGTDIGHWCAHCVLEKLGGLDWYIILDEPSKRIRENVEECDREVRQLNRINDRTITANPDQISDTGD